MSTPIGINGGILVGDEETAYGTESASKVQIHAISSSLGLRRSTRKQAAWASARSQYIEQGVSYVDGEITAALTKDNATMGNLLGAYALAVAAAANWVYTLGAYAPGYDSLTVAVNHGTAPEYTYTGLVPSSLRIELNNDGPCTYTAGFAGKAVAKEGEPTTMSPPLSSLIAMPSDIGTLTIVAGGSDTFDFNKITLDIAIPTAYAGLSCVGATTVRRAYWSGPMSLSGSIEMDLDDDDTANVNTVAFLDDYIADGNLGAITVYDGTNTWITIDGAEMVGDPPSYQADEQGFVCNFEMENMALLMTGA